MMGITEMTLPMNTSLNVTVSLGVSGAPETGVTTAAVGIVGGLDTDKAAAGPTLPVAALLAFLRIVVLFLGLTGAVKHWALGWR